MNILELLVLLIGAAVVAFAHAPLAWVIIAVLVILIVLRLMSGERIAMVRRSNTP